MKKRLVATFAGQAVYHPPLFAAFFIVFLYAHNIREMTVDQIWLPLGVSLAGAVMLWLVLSFIVRSAAKGALGSTIFLFIFFTYGRLYELLEKWDAFVPSHARFLPTILLAYGYCVYFISLAKRDFRVTTKVLNIVAVVLVVMNLLIIGSYQVKQAACLSKESVAMEQINGRVLVGGSDNLPDIYHVVLDEYASMATIKECYGYDNSDFAEALIARGFFIAQNSRTHVAATEWSIASIVNMERVSPELETGLVRRMIAENRVAAYLRSRGYKIVYIGFLSRTCGGADQCYDFYRSSGNLLTDEFVRVTCATTMLGPAYLVLNKLSYSERQRNGTLLSLEQVVKLSEMPGPKFVFVHIDCPHVPFVFGANGEALPAEKFFDYVDRRIYLGQYIFITREVKRTVFSLLDAAGETPPIVIIQSDHGPKILSREHSLRIFNAQYLPGSACHLLHDSISPVNTYRVIFNYYFGDNHELLPD